MRLWWKDLGHSFFYKRMAPLTNRIFFFSWRNSLKSLSWFSLLSLSVQAKRRTLFFLFGVSRLAVWKTGKNLFPLETKILSYFPHSANTRRSSLHFSFSLGCLATKRKEGSLSSLLGFG
jgi:hypothetical protein